MKELTFEQTKEVNGGGLPLALLLVSDFAVGVTAGAALRKLWNKYS
jgi:lactobin A/cerein 7B family class IIb bacteriocin